MDYNMSLTTWGEYPISLDMFKHPVILQKISVTEKTESYLEYSSVRR